MVRFALALSACALLLVGAPSLAGAHSDTTQSALEASLLRELNHIRAAHGLRPLAASRPLARAADFHGESMGRLGYFSHTSADGTTFDKRIARYYRPTSHFWMVGENLLWTTGTSIAPAEAVQMWLESPAHRRNILEPRWRSIGISAVFAPHAGGDFEGEDVLLLVTDFGARS